jgi:hypothetical protein
MLPPWLTKPEVIFGTVLTLICFIGSLYSTEIRRGLRWPGQKMTRKMIESHLELSEGQLQTLQRIHGDAYQLVLWLAWIMISLLRSQIMAVLFGLVVSSLLYLVTKDRWYLSPFAFLGIAIGNLANYGTRSYQIIKALYDYENSVARLKDTIDQCKAELAR